MLKAMDDLYEEDAYPRRSNKFFKPALKGEKKENPVLKKWIESQKTSGKAYFISSSKLNDVLNIR